MSAIVSELSQPTPHGPVRHQAVVIGGGLAGLTAAYELLQNGVIPVVLEASDRVGGFLAPLTVTDEQGKVMEFDAGAESFSTRSTAVADLVAELGLETTAPSGATAWCFPASGEPFPLPTAGVLGIPSDWSAPDLVRALGPEAIDRARADEWLNTGVGDRSNLAAFVASRMGPEVVDRLVRPIAGGVHSTDPEKLDCTVIHPNFWEIFERAGSLSGAVAQVRAAAPAGSAVRGITGGLHRIPTSLRDRITAGGGSVLCNTSATSLAQIGDGWLVDVTTQDGELSQVLADRVVVATPANRALELLRSAGVVTDQEALTAPRGTDISLVTLVVDSAELAHTRPRGSGALIAPGGVIAAKGTTHANVKWEWVADRLAAGRSASGSARLAAGHSVAQAGRSVAGASRSVVGMEAQKGEISAHSPATTNLLGSDPNLVRFSYGRHGDSQVFTDQELAAVAARDFELVYGPLSAEGFRILQTHVVRWPDALAPVTPALKELSTRVHAQVDELPGLVVTGAWASGTGLAAVIPHARNSVEYMLSKFRKLQ